MRYFFKPGWTAALALSMSTAMAGDLMAQDPRQGDLRIGQAYARPTVANQSSGAVYLDIENTGQRSDQLLTVSSPAAAHAELHTMSMEGNIMRMREVDGIEIKPGEKISMVPGRGYHVMLMSLKQPLKPGDKVPLVLSFRHAGKIQTRFVVEEKKAHASPSPAMDHRAH